MDPSFASHRLNEAGFAKAKVIADSFDLLLVALSGLCAPGRELSIVKTKLEEACFFAKKAMASHPGNQEPKP